MQILWRERKKERVENQFIERWASYKPGGTVCFCKWPNGRLPSGSPFYWQGGFTVRVSVHRGAIPLQYLFPPNGHFGRLSSFGCCNQDTASFVLAWLLLLLLLSPLCAPLFAKGAPFSGTLYCPTDSARNEMGTLLSLICFTVENRKVRFRWHKCFLDRGKLLVIVQLSKE